MRATANVLGGVVLVVAILVSGCAQQPVPGEPTPTREPKNLVQKVSISLGDTYFADASGAHGGTFRVTAGQTVGLYFKNVGAAEHEVLFGRGGVTYNDDIPEGFNVSLFEAVAADVFVYKPQKVEVGTEQGLGELEMEAGGDLWVRAKFPEGLKGEWEMACFVPGHYEAGMKAKLLIE